MLTYDAAIELGKIKTLSTSNIKGHRHKKKLKLEFVLKIRLAF